ncbi:GGDEF domain-containing protein [Vibrio maerlii]|uniref:GGDEF domain-containing protein n=1 Tax=Vibrio maerlii TaxID=2231648 RepID=UPI000F4DBE8D|nr:GGDEF domain-containing protein [Vibrio maerlii]
MNHRYLPIATLMTVTCLLLAFVLDGSVVVDSAADIVFESMTLFVIIYVMAVSKSKIVQNRKLLAGVIVLICNKLYDVVTEIEVIDEFIDNYEVLDTLLEDGMLQVSVLLIAFGISEMIRKAEDTSLTDALTGLFNRNKLERVSLSNFELVYFDLDGFKEINDTLGHQYGDVILSRFGKAINSNLNKREQGFRLGGDEFVVVLEPGRCIQFIDELRSCLNEQPILFSYGKARATKATLKVGLAKADQAMYDMKRQKKTIAPPAQHAI